MAPKQRAILTENLDFALPLTDHVESCAQSARTFIWEDTLQSETKIQELEAKVEQLTTLVAKLTTERSGEPARLEHVEVMPARSSRRGMLKLAGAAAVGAAAAAATGALPVAATNGIDILDPALSVRNDYTGNAALAAFLFQAGNQFGNGAAEYPCALAGWSGSGGANLPHGVYGYTSHAGYGVIGSGGGAASRGVLARGSRSNLLISAEGVAAPSRTANYVLGDVINDSTGNLWLNVEAGAPGKWRKLAGPSTAGSLQLLATPKRVYSTRAADEPVAVGPKTPLSAGTRTIDCTAGSSGVPTGATGLVLNVTAIAASANGFLSVSPGASGFSGTSTLNWTANGAVVANGVTVGSGAAATIDVTIGGGGTADFIVDVMGFYA